MKEVKKATNLADGVKNLIAAANEDYVDRTNHDGLSYDDLLKPAGWNAPARNKPRGNVLEGGFPVNWTGPLYLN